MPAESLHGMPIESSCHSSASQKCNSVAPEVRAARPRRVAVHSTACSASPTLAANNILPQSKLGVGASSPISHGA